MAPPQTGGRGEVVQWLTPAPLWTEDAVGVASGGLLQPWIAELTTDTFVDDFLALLAGTGGASPADLAATRPGTTVPETGALRLFQPLSQRYYLVAATLACRRPGIPDHAVRPGRGERVSFVLRRRDPDGTEHGFVPGGAGRPATWRPATAAALVPGERELPMHPAPVGAFAEPGTAAAALGMAAAERSTRTVFYGYIPVSGRDGAVLPLADPAATLATVQASMPLPDPPENPTVDALVARVVQPWSALRSAPPPSGQGSWPTYPSLYVILDLADWLATNLDAVFQAITQSADVPADSAADHLIQAITKITVRVGNPQGIITLAQAITDLAPFLALVTGDTGLAGPFTTYDLTGGTLPGGWLDPPKTASSLAGLAAAALAEAGNPVTVPPELEGLIKDDPVPTGAPGTSNGATYVIRTVFAHAPCQPVISEPTQPFELARALDPDAPARKILIQMPDISNLRQFRRGVAIEMSPGLRRLMDRVTPGLLKGDGLGSDPGLQLGMICSFSLQIVTLVAFIVMFIFLILLNIVFWWLPFLKVCFPVPVKPGNPKGPTP